MNVPAKAIAQWVRTDPILARVALATDLPAWDLPGKDGFAALAGSIIAQQVSLAAGQTIQARFLERLGSVCSPEAVLRETPESLRACGLSRAKATYILDLADKTVRGEVAFDRFPAMSDEAVMAELVAVKGIGVWTAKMFLMFHLDRPDVVAPEDLGLRIAVREIYGVAEGDEVAFMRKQAAAWSPWGTWACKVLWAAREAPLKRN